MSLMFVLKVDTYQRKRCQMVMQWTVLPEKALCQQPHRKYQHSVRPHPPTLNRRCSFPCCAVGCKRYVCRACNSSLCQFIAKGSSRALPLTAPKSPARAAGSLQAAGNDGNGSKSKPQNDQPWFSLIVVFLTPISTYDLCFKEFFPIFPPHPGETSCHRSCHPSVHRCTWRRSRCALVLGTDFRTGWLITRFTRWYMMVPHHSTTTRGFQLSNGILMVDDR